MQWSDEAIVLALRRHGEGSAIAELFTREHGRHLGLIRGARRESAALQAGNSVAATWRAPSPRRSGQKNMRSSRLSVVIGPKRIFSMRPHALTKPSKVRSTACRRLVVRCLQYVSSSFRNASAADTTAA